MRCVVGTLQGRRCVSACLCVCVFSHWVRLGVFSHWVPFRCVFTLGAFSFFVLHSLPFLQSPTGRGGAFGSGSLELGLK